MIVLTKEKNKVTFESEVGNSHTTVTFFHDGQAFKDEYIPKDEAFDLIQLLIGTGWKQGE